MEHASPSSAAKLLPLCRSSLLAACSAAMLNFPLASYIEAGEFSKDQLDAIDARVAAGKPVPGQLGGPMGVTAVTSARGQGV